ncbi:hypothetical protein ACTWJ8_39780 (plasmid) [Streptomyces sp. SDT5-1]|uniref:hypothetical protein n=1 Tax=Streptomyces sp. SDT5-1 TaxID=3406418 RepID=UPI003FD2D6F4
MSETAESPTLSTLTTYIATEASDADCDRILAVMKERRKALRQQAAAAIVVGLDVEVVNIKPAALKGHRGTVKEIDGRSATVKFTAESTRELRHARSRQIFVPAGVTELEMDGIPLVCLRRV